MGKRPHTVLVVEDDPASRAQVNAALKSEFDVIMAADPAEAATFAREVNPTAIVLDLGLPPAPTDPEEGLRFLEDLRKYHVDSRVIIYTESSYRRHAIRALRAGAYDVLAKPGEIDLLKFALQRACRLAELEREQVVLPQDGEEIDEMVGTSESIRKTFSDIRKVAPSDVPVLITGESGTGKELTARAIHARSPRKNGPFVAINCGAIPDTLLEAELFGYEKGAFTGAVQLKKGKVEYAQGGSLFLDEIGDLSLALQVKLLRFLETSTMERVGGHQPIRIDARIIAATQIDVQSAIARGTFREDLYYRLGVVHLHIAPLRHRGDDSVLIGLVVLRRVREQTRSPVRGLSKEAIEAIRKHSWPGNVRELVNKIRRAVVMTERPYITPEDLDLAVLGSEKLGFLSLKGGRERFERKALVLALALHHGNLSQVAEELEVSRPTLYSLLEKYRMREILSRDRSIIRGGGSLDGGLHRES